jgi:membrane protein implicated in regulation of membrane protease activity
MDILLSYLSLADAAYALTAAYWICFIVGGGLLLVSVLGGGDHGSVDVHADTGFDFHADTDAHVEFDAGGATAADADLHVDTGHFDAGHAHGVAGVATWFSMRFVVFFLAIFGAFGLVLSYLTRASVWTGFGVALVAGLVVGQVVHQVFRAIQRGSGNSTPQPQDYVNKLARVTIPIRHPDPGEIVIQVRSAERYLPAVACGTDRSHGAGDQVVVVGYRGGVAQVISRQEFEQQTRSRGGAQ